MYCFFMEPMLVQSDVVLDAAWKGLLTSTRSDLAALLAEGMNFRIQPNKWNWGIELVAVGSDYGQGQQVAFAGIDPTTAIVTDPLRSALYASPLAA